MRYLLDTHAILWFLAKDNSLSSNAKEIIEQNESVYVSIASLWEISIKYSIKKLDILLLNMNILIDQYIKNSFTILPKHIEEVSTLPFIHRDPFDRMLVAQAKVEDMTLITHDQYIPQYPIKTV